jgi:hypothetical protein
VAVTPLFWHPDRGVYWMFDFNAEGKVVEKTPTYNLIQGLPRLRGSPEYAPELANVARPGGPKLAIPRSPGAGADVRSARRSSVVMRVANTDGQGVRLRAEPSRTARSISVVKDGVTVEATGEAQEHGGLTWQPVRAQNGDEGWIAIDYLAKVE